MLIGLPWLTDCDPRPTGWISGFRWGAPLLMVAREECGGNTSSRQEPLPSLEDFRFSLGRAPADGRARGVCEQHTLAPGAHSVPGPRDARARPAFSARRQRGEREGWGRHLSPQPKFDDSFVFRALRAKP